MYKCLDCGQSSSELRSEADYTIHSELDSGPVTETQHYRVCPHCGSEAVEERGVCELCNEEAAEYENGYCELCMEVVDGVMNKAYLELQNELNVNDCLTMDAIEDWIRRRS